MTVQTSYDRPVIGYEGQLFSRSKDTKIVSMIGDGINPGNPPLVPGLTVSIYNSNDRMVSVGGDTPIGILLRPTGLENQPDPATSFRYNHLDTVAVLQRGMILVKSVAQTSAGANVLIDVNTGQFSTGTPAGDFFEYPGAKWMTDTTGANQLAVLNLEYLASEVG